MIIILLNFPKECVENDLDFEGVRTSLCFDNELDVNAGGEKVMSVETNSSMETSVKEHIPVTSLHPNPSPKTSKHESISTESKHRKSEKRKFEKSGTFTGRDRPNSSDINKNTLLIETKSKNSCPKQENDELPTITLKKRDRSWRKSLAIMMTESPEPTKPIEVIDCEKIDSDLMEDLAKLPKHKMCLTSEFRTELEQISHESQLTESQIEQMVLGSKDYLFSIFMGKHISRRHADYKKGGTARFNLNFQVNLGMFTETQQDAVMDTLMTIFCKRHHKYMDYILKVLLPEMMISILMEVKHTSYEETETLMSGYIM